MDESFALLDLRDDVDGCFTIKLDGVTDELEIEPDREPLAVFLLDLAG